MTPAELLSYVRLQGADIWAHKDRLRFRAPKGVMTPDLSRELARHRSEILAILRGNRQRSTTTSPPPIRPVDRAGHLPLSFAQQRFWFHHQIKPGSIVFNVPLVFSIDGHLNVAALDRSLVELFRRHEVFRMKSITVDGKPALGFDAPPSTVLTVDDLRSLPESRRESEAMCIAQDEMRLPFDLCKSPMLRCKLLRLNDHRWVMAMSTHHFAVDGWAISLLYSELSALYRASVNGERSRLAELQVQYADFSAWQQHLVKSDLLSIQLSYWHKQLEGVQVLSLPAARPRPPIQNFKGATESFRLSASLSDAIRGLSRREGATVFMLLLAALQLLLHRYTRQDDIAVGTGVSTRNRKEIEVLIGSFANMLILRTDFSGNPTFRSLLRRVRKVSTEAYAHQDLPFEELVKHLKVERDLSRNPLFQVAFIFHQRKDEQEFQLPGLTLTQIPIDLGTTTFDLSLVMKECGETISGAFRYSTDMFRDTFVARMSNHFRRLLENIVAEPDAKLNEFEIQSVDEGRKRIVSRKKLQASKLNRLRSAKGQIVDVSQMDLVRTGHLEHGDPLPFLIQPAVAHVDLADWLTGNMKLIQETLLQHGAILFRDFQIDSVTKFEAVATSLCSDLFRDYEDLPQEENSNQVYASTPYPQDESILFHNESSHMHRWPMKQFFCCLTAAHKGGETPLVDCRKIYELMNPGIRKQFEQKQLMYVRNFTDGLDISWQEFYQTTDKSVVETRCREARSATQWTDIGLRTWAVRHAVSKHPETGEKAFFNQVQLHHPSCLTSGVRESLLSMLGEEGFPRQVYFGDGTPISDSVMAHIRHIYHEISVSFQWQEGDVLILDNMLTAHGRNPYEGPRKIVVAMGEMVSQGQ